MTCSGTLASCTCSACVEACKRFPGWFGLDDAEAALDAGLAKRLMLDFWEEFPENISILSPASEGCEGDDAPDMPAFAFGWTKGRCVFLSPEGLCLLHDTPYKPLQCRTMISREQPPGEWIDNRAVRDLWDSDRGRALVARWEKEVGR